MKINQRYQKKAPSKGFANFTKKNRKKSAHVDFDSLFNAIESDREGGIIKSKVLTDKTWYEESHENPGMFFRMTSEGEKTLGKFVDGKFVEEKKHD